MKALLSALLALATTNAYAQSLKDKKIIAAQNDLFKQEVEHTNKECGTKISGKIDWSSFSKGKVDLTKYSIGDGFCQDTLTGASDLCTDDIGKKALKSRLSQFSCTIGAKESVSFKAGMLSLVFTKESASLRDDVTELLGNSL